MIHSRNVRLHRFLWRTCNQHSNQRSAGRSLASRADAPGGRAQGSARLGQQRRRAYTRVAEVVRGARQLRLFESIDVMVTYVSRCIWTGVLHNASILPNPIRSDRGREKECRPSGCCENTPSRNVLDQDRSPAWTRIGRKARRMCSGLYSDGPSKEQHYDPRAPG